MFTKITQIYEEISQFFEYKISNLFSYLVLQTALSFERILILYKLLAEFCYLHMYFIGTIKES
jgi:hypothetical protein